MEYSKKILSFLLDVGEMMLSSGGEVRRVEDTIRRMEADGVDTIVEIGPGKTLSSFVKKTAPSIKTYNIDTADDFERVTAALKGENL